MEEKFNIYVSKRAENDLKEIVLYIKEKLEEPNIARNYSKLLKEKIKTLEHFPERFAIIDDFRTRKLVIRNYVVFYSINEENRVVNVKRILYGATDWENKI